jgi:Replication protein
VSTEHLGPDDRQLTRFQLCGRRMAGNTAAVEVRLGASGAHYAGVQTCGSVWVCPVCAAKIREQRATELDHAARRHVGLVPVIGPLRPSEAREWVHQPRAAVGGLEFLTFTLRHSRADALVDTLDHVAKGWSWMQRQRRFRALRDRLGFGFVRALEITLTKTGGWHPHLHVMLFTDRPWTLNERADAEGIMWELWREWCDSLDPVNRRHRPTRKRGFVWEPVRMGHGVHAAARYLSKLTMDDREWGPAHELSRGDQKDGRAGRGSRNPFAVGLSAAETGDRGDLAKWLEYEAATHGRRLLTWSTGLRDRLELGEEVEDQALADGELDEGRVVGYLPRDDFRAVRAAGLLLAMLQAVEADELAGFWRVLGRARQQASRHGTAHSFVTYHTRR